MTEVEKGKFCLKCSKKVIDFSKLSQQEIIDLLKNPKGKICARIAEKQINTPLPELVENPKISVNYFSKFAASFMIAASIFTITSCQSNQKEQQTHFGQSSNEYLEEKTLANEKQTSINKDSENKLEFKGIILSQVTSKPLENAQVTFITLFETYTTYTDKYGKFNLEIPSDIVEQYNIVNLSFKNIFDEYDDNFSRLDNHYKSENIMVLKNELENFKFKAKKEIYYIGMVELSEERKNREPIVFINGKKIKFDDYKKLIMMGKESHKILGNKEQYYLDPESATSLYGKEAKDGAILLIESKN